MKHCRMTLRTLAALFLLLTVCAAGLGPFPAAAADTDGSFITDDIYRQLPAEDQERLIEEATRVNTYCNGRQLFSMLHDCRCVAAKFLEERTRNYDPTRDPISVADEVAKQCPNIPGVAGFAYNQCMKMYRHTLPVGLQDYCTCHANTFADLYAENPRSHFSALTAIGTAATLACSKKVSPNPIRPDE